MEFLRKSWAQIRLLFANLGMAERWLIVALVTVMVLAGVLVMTFYVGATETVTISQFAPDRQTEVLGRLKAAGIRAEVKAGQIHIPRTQLETALVALQAGDLMSSDASAAFDKLIATQTPWTTNQQNAQAFLVAKSKYLAAVIQKMAGVRRAEVWVDRPQETGFGVTKLSPTAMVTVVMNSNRGIDKPMVEAIAGLVSSAVAGMKRESVTIVDALQGRQYTVKTGQEAGSSELLEMVHHQEEYKREQINGVLSYIPGVIVAVNIITDPTRSKQVETVEYTSGEPLVREKTSETETRGSSDAGAPGARSNTGVEVEAGGGVSGSLSKSTTSETDYGSKLPIKKVSASETGHTVQQISVTVNVPRSYFVQVFKRLKVTAPAEAAPGSGPGAASAEPSEADLQPIVQQQLAQIEAQVEPLISSTGKGVVKAHMVPDRAFLMGASSDVAMAGYGGGAGAFGGAAGGASAGGVAGILGSDWIKPVGVGVLALVSLGIMLSMVRKATQAPPMPSVEELAGVPPTLPAEDDLVGEAEETAPSLAGVELDEEELRHRKIAEQIGDLIKGNPGEAAQLVRRWVRTED